MNFWRQLRWRIVAAQMLVVVVGVLVLVLMADVVASTTLARTIQPLLAELLADSPPTLTAEISAELLEIFRGTVNQALLVAALAATLAGLVSGLLLLREILRPLNQIAHSSQRIAAGHYDERVTVPASDELAVVANNFNQMAAALEQVEQQRTILIGNVAHELRTPLTGLEGYIEGLIDGIFPSDPETFSMMQRELRRLRRLVDDLQSLSRVEAGQIALQCSSFDLIALVRQVLTQLQPQASAQNLEITIAEAPVTLLVYADADRSAQVLVNLIGNAIQYTPEGGRISVRLSASDDTAQVAITDTGIGIPAEALPYIFERFYRVDPSRARSSGGSGIGLTITRHLIWAMGGTINASSPGPGQGSTFSFTLPLAIATRAA